MCIIDHYPLGNQRTETSGGLNISEKLGWDSLGLINACYWMKSFLGLILVIGTIEIRARLYVTCWELNLKVNYIF